MGIAGSVGSLGAGVAFGDASQGGPALGQAFADGLRCQWAGDLAGEPSDLKGEQVEVFAGAGDVRAGRLTAVQTGLPGDSAVRARGVA